jgi:hypothetical protein
MAKRKDLLLTESTTMRMMGLAGIGSLANPFLREQVEEMEELDEADSDPLAGLVEEMEELDETYGEEEMEEGSGLLDTLKKRLETMEGTDESESGSWNKDEDKWYYDDAEGGEYNEATVNWSNPKMIKVSASTGGYGSETQTFHLKSETDIDDIIRFIEEVAGLSETQQGGSGVKYADHDLDAGDDESWKEEDDDEDLEEGKMCEVCHKSPCACEKEEELQESVRKSMKRLKKLLEQAEAGAEPPAPEGGEMPPEPAPGGAGGDEMEAKIKEFVKKLGELVQETLGVQVTVEEGEGEPEMPEEASAPEAPAGAAGAPPAPMAEAINRLVNKVARRVKARLMEAKGEKDKAIETKRKMAAKGKYQMKMKALKEKQAAAKKKEMEMKKKKAAMAKKK